MGSLFWFELPLPIHDAVAATAPAQRASRSPEPGQAGARVLLVEDNPVNPIVARAMLDAFGAAVTTAVDGAAALQRLRESRFDLVFMDCEMPVMDGFETVRRWRADEAAGHKDRRPIIALMAYAMHSDRERCLAEGFDDHLSKPFQRDDLARAARR